MIVFYSKSNNTKRFVGKLNHKNSTLYSYDGKEKYILITPTYFFGQVPVEVDEFLKENSKNMLGVISSGNKNWGENYALAGNKIAQQYNVPLLYKFELSGSKKDIENVDKIVNNMLK